MACMNCTWSEKAHSNTVALDLGLTCGNYSERLVAERNAGLTVVPDRCERCKEALTPRVTKGSYLCKCDQPRAPRSVLEAAERAPMTGQVRYGGR